MSSKQKDKDKDPVPSYYMYNEADLYIEKTAKQYVCTGPGQYELKDFKYTLPIPEKPIEPFVPFGPIDTEHLSKLTKPDVDKIEEAAAYRMYEDYATYRKKDDDDDDDGDHKSKFPKLPEGIPGGLKLKPIKLQPDMLGSGMDHTALLAASDPAYAASYSLSEQRHDWMRITFPYVNRLSHIRVDTHRRLIRIDGVFIRLLCPILPLEWHPHCPTRAGIVRHTKAGVTIFLPKAVPWYVNDLQSRNWNKPMPILAISFTRKEEEKDMMRKFIDNAIKKLQEQNQKNSQLAASYIRFVYAGRMAHFHDMMEIQQQEKRPFDCVLICGHDEGKGIELADGSKILPEQIAHLLSVFNSAPDKNRVSGLPYGQWMASGVRLVAFLNSYNGNIRSTAESLSRIYPVPTLVFEGAYLKKEYIGLNEFYPWLYVLLFGYYMNDSKVVIFVNRVVEKYKEKYKDKEKELTLYYVLCSLAMHFHEKKMAVAAFPPTDVPTDLKAVELDGEAMRPFLFNNDGPMDEKFCTYSDMIRIGYTKLKECIDAPSFQSYLVSFVKAKKAAHEDLPSFDSRQCVVCRAPNSSACTGCFKVNYCSAEHQQLDRKRHKKECKSAQENKGEEKSKHKEKGDSKGEVVEDSKEPTKEAVNTSTEISVAPVDQKEVKTE